MAESHTPHKSSLATLTLGALGIVFGDIGTSPLYAFKEAFGSTHGLPLTPENVFAVLSMMFWTVTLIVTLKYVSIVLRFDNNGEGGILALLAFASRSLRRSPRLVWIASSLAVAGASLFYGDAIITPAISVLSAVEGLAVAAPGLDHWVVPITIGIIIGLFAIQSRGTLLAEAGTGTGKTFAYLVPALLWGGKVIISTGTKNLQDQLTFSGMALNTSLLLDKTQVLPTPSDTVDPATLPADSKVTLDVVVGDASANRFKIPGLANKYFYPDKTIDQLKLVSTPSDLVAADDDTVVRTPTGYAWVQRSSSGVSLLTVVPESFVATPTALQKASWLSQYSDKIVKITQRSAEQTNFLKMLTDRYTYFYDAATNVLQLLASLARQQARN
jgi:hypothetical protein